ncbi:hypothetical protein L6452_34286 [Arctium lappa]|uniref:Uncharacterized protein n=1 Tax=Arctium lappa TaxID=4217 RepID=A0ACB8YIS8_ARCLA|nr:hypothetical protein L6452_34286 [Arctium lappa]
MADLYHWMMKIVSHLPVFIGSNFIRSTMLGSYRNFKKLEKYLVIETVCINLEFDFATIFKFYFVTVSLILHHSHFFEFLTCDEVAFVNFSMKSLVF